MLNPRILETSLFFLFTKSTPLWRNDNAVFFSNNILFLVTPIIAPEETVKPGSLKTCMNKSKNVYTMVLRKKPVLKNVN